MFRKMNVIRVVVLSLLALRLAADTLIPGTLPMQNSATGTTQYKLVIEDSSGNAVIAGTGTTSGVLGVAGPGAGTTGQVSVIYAWPYQLIADGAITANHYIGISSTSAGTGHDVGASCPASGQVVGLWDVTAASPGSTPQNAIIVPGLCTASSGSGLNAPSGTGTMKYTGSSNTAQATAHDVAVLMTAVAASASGTAYTATTSPTYTPAAGDLILFKADVASTGSVTLNLNSTGAVAVKRQGGGTNLGNNDWLAGQWTLLLFDGTFYQMQGPTGNATGGAPTAGTGVSVSGTAVSVNNSDQTYFAFRDDFIAMNLLSGSSICASQVVYYCTVAGTTPATIHGITAAANHSGILQMASSVANPSYAWMGTSPDIQSAVTGSIPPLNGVSGWSATFSFNLEQVSSNQIAFVGLADASSPTYLPNSALGIRFDQVNSSDTNYMLTCIRASNSTSATSAGVAPATGWHTVTISPGTNANTIKFVFDGSTNDNLCGSTSIPTTNLFLDMGFRNQDTTTAKKFDLDFWSFQMPLTR